MIKHTIVDKSLRRLTDHFGARVAIPPPAAAADLARLEALVGPLPRRNNLACRAPRLTFQVGPFTVETPPLHKSIAVKGAPVMPRRARFRFLIAPKVP